MTRTEALERVAEATRAYVGDPTEQGFARMAGGLRALDALPPAAPKLLEALEALYRGYVRTLEVGRDRIIDLGGSCDLVSVMEAGDPCLRAARAAIAAAKRETPDGP